jgi:hypothetical protein
MELGAAIIRNDLHRSSACLQQRLHVAFMLRLLMELDYSVSKKLLASYGKLMAYHNEQC